MIKRGRRLLTAALPLSAILIASCLVGAVPGKGLAAYNFTCSSCHAMPPLDGSRDRLTGSFRGNHQTHQPVSAKIENCAICHNSVSFTTGHYDGKISFVPNINASPASGTYKVGGFVAAFRNQTSVPVLGSCSGVNCHFESVTPTWGGPSFGYTSEAVNDCGRCHGAPPAGTGPANAGGAAGSHTRHNAYYAGPAQCKKCHPDHLAEASKFAHATSAGNRGLLIQLKTPKNVSEGSYSGLVNDYLPSQTNAFGNCTNIYCHSDGKSFSAPYTRAATAAPVWGESVSCYSCHNGLPPYTSGKANSHAKHPFTCDKCHSSVANDASAIINTSLHVNQQYDLQAGGGAAFVVAVQGNPATPSQCSGISCHGGSSAIWGATLSCASCHGATFTTFSSLAKKGAHSMHVQTENVPTSYSGSGVGNIGTAASSYQFGCASCHNPAKAGHANNVANASGGSGEVYFGYTSATMKGAYVPGALQPGMDGALKWTAGTGCNTTYCHSNGRNGAGAVNVAWNAAKGSLACTGCHGNATSNTLSGKHAAHLNPVTNVSLGVGNGLGCIDCHAKTASNNTTIVNKLKHVNKFIDFSSTHGGGSDRYNGATGQCSNIYCHSNGNPAALVYRNLTGSKSWDGSATLGCNGCHGTGNPDTGAPDYTNGGHGSATANSHTRHVAGNGITDTKGCAACHVKTVSQSAPGQFKDYTAVSYHLNGTPNVYFKPLAGKTGTWNGSTCSNTYCHGAGASAAWGTTTSLPCNSCHSATATDAYWAANSAHRLHWQGSTLPTSYTATPGNATGDASNYRFTCSSCHGRGAVHTGGPANGSGAAEVYFGYTSATLKGSYGYGTTQGTTDNGFAWTNGGAGCNTTYCHSDGQGGSGRQAVAWSTAAGAGTCVACHDTKQIGTTATGLSGKHNAHMNPTANPSLGVGNGFNCIDCHAKTVSNNTAIGNKLKHVNKYIDYSGAKAGGSARYDRAAKQCSNIYCHSNGNPSALVYVDPPAWNSTSTLGCNGCHGKNNPTTGAPDYDNGGLGSATANSHAKHVSGLGIIDTAGCAKCHMKTVDASVAGKFRNYSSTHLSGAVNVAFQSTYGGSYSAGTCSSVLCHSNGRGGYTSPKWGESSNCGYCHPIASLGGAHAKHVDLTQVPIFYTFTANRSAGNDAAGKQYFGCSNCHPLVNTAHSTGTIMLDFRPAVAGVGTLRSRNAAGITAAGRAGTANGGTTADSVSGSVVKCLNLYCHSNGYLTNPVYATTPNWYGGVFTGDRCANCHGNSPNSTIVGSAPHYNTNALGEGVLGGHIVGIHYDTIYTGTTGLATAGTTATSGHGNAATSTTMNCDVCHFATVTSARNDNNIVCKGCHFSGNTVGALSGNLAVIANRGKHVNGRAEVQFNQIQVRSKAQMQDPSFGMAIYSSNWTRVNGYKGSGSYDIAVTPLNTATMWNSATKTCSSVACHNGQAVTWGSTGGATYCYSCHHTL